MCKSGIQYDTDSESDEEGIFHSIAEKSNRHQHQEKSLNSGQSTVAVTLNIGQGLLTMYTPVRDSLQNVIPGQQGELIMKLEDALIFAVTSYKGDPNLSYISTIVKNVMLYQCGLTAMPAQTPALQPTNGSVPKHCLPVIYRCESGANVAQNSTEKDMLTVAVRVQATHQTHRIKVCDCCRNLFLIISKRVKFKCMPFLQFLTNFNFCATKRFRIIIRTNIKDGILIFVQLKKL